MLLISFLALICFGAGVTVSLRNDAVIATDEYDNPTQTDQTLVSADPVASADLLVGDSRKSASVLKKARILKTIEDQRALLEDYDVTVAEAEYFKAKTSFYDLILDASENQNTGEVTIDFQVVLKKASVMAPTYGVPNKPFAPLKPFAPQNPIAPLKPPSLTRPITPQQPKVPFQPVAPKMPTEVCPSGLKYNTCCQGCGSVFTTKKQLKKAVSNYDPSNTRSEGNINCWDVAQVTDMSNLFQGSNLDERIDCWNTGQVTVMYDMFNDNTYFNQPLNQWNTSRVTAMYGMFNNATSFNQPLSRWDVSQVTNMAYMFYLAHDFNQPLNGWDVSQVTDMGWMFGKAENFNQPLFQWNTSRVSSMKNMFVSGSFNQPLNQWDISKVTNMRRMFYNASKFNQPLEIWMGCLMGHLISTKIYAHGITQ